MGNYRQTFIEKKPGKKRMGKKGLWYRCANCGKWCGRAGGDRITLHPDELMEVDHIRPWSMGGSDKVWNLQPLCRPCNRSKSNSITFKDRLKMLKNDIIHLDFLKAWFKKAGRQNKILRKLGITARK